MNRGVAELEAVVGQLKARLEQAEQGAKRQAASFSKGEPKGKGEAALGASSGSRGGPPGPATRGRQDARGSWGEPCRGAVVEDRVQAPYQVDIPPVEPVVTQCNVHIGHCQKCGRRGQGRHGQPTRLI